MTRWKCLGCGATYADTNPDGSAYYHACGSVIDHAAVEQLATKAGLTADAWLASHFDAAPMMRRPNHRDENPDPRAELPALTDKRAKSTYQPKAEGAGREKLE